MALCKGLSTEFMLLAMTEKWKQASDNNSYVGAVSHTQFYHANFKLLAFLFMNGSCVISQIDHNILLFTPSSLPLVVFIVASHRNLSWGQGCILFLLTTFRIVLEILEMYYLYADDTTGPFFGDSIDEAFATLNVIIDNELQWSKNNQLTIHPIKTEAMLFRKSPFIGPLPPLYFRSGTIQVVESITCLGVKLDCRLSKSKHVSQARKSFVRKG